MCQLPEAILFIAGDGYLLDPLKKQVSQLQLQKQVIFLGTLSHDELVNLYNIADILILASSREGWPNVLLESMACGTPVVAANVWGVSEVVQKAEAGLLINERTADAIAMGVNQLWKDYPGRLATRQYAENFSWQETIDSLSFLFNKIQGKD